MDTSTIIALVLGCVNIFGAFVLFPMKNRIDDLEKIVQQCLRELGDYKLHVAENYITKDVLEQHMSRIEKTLDEIKDILKDR